MNEPRDDALTDELFVAVQQALGRRVEALRDARGLTQAEVALHAGMNQGHWSKIERGELNLRLSTLLRVQYALGLDFFESLFGPGPSRSLLDNADDGETGDGHVPDTAGQPST